MAANVIVAWASCLMWLGVAVWVFMDARRMGRSAFWNAVATFLVPGVGLAVYLGSRAAERRAAEVGRSAAGDRLVRELTAEVERLRAELAAERARARKSTKGP